MTLLSHYHSYTRMLRKDKTANSWFCLLIGGKQICSHQTQWLIELWAAAGSARVGEPQLLKAVRGLNRHLCELLGAGRHLNAWDVMFNPIVFI